MAKKSKIFNEIRSLQKQDHVEQKMLKKLEKKIQRGPMGKEFSGMVANPKGEVKMSEALKAFIGPYFELAQNKRQQEQLVSIAATAWNLAIMPEDERKTMLDSVIKEGWKGAGPLERQEIRELITELIERKQEYFADNKRMIIDFQFQELGDTSHLSVASTLEKTNILDSDSFKLFG